MKRIRQNGTPPLPFEMDRAGQATPFPQSCPCLEISSRAGRLEPWHRNPYHGQATIARRVDRQESRGIRGTGAHAGATATKEEEIRIEVERQLAFLETETGVRLEGKHEFTVAKGHIDSFYTRVLIEYKNPSSPSDRLGPRLDSPGSQKVVEQIKLRFPGLKNELGHPLESLFGVGCDGKQFIFVRFRDKRWQIEEPVEVNKVSSERFLWALFNLGQKGKPFQPEYLAGDFGAMEGSIATEGIHALYDAIAATDHPKAQTFFKQWKILFGEVCGYDVDNPSDKMKKLAEFYGRKSKTSSRRSCSSHCTPTTRCS